MEKLLLHHIRTRSNQTTEDTFSMNWFVFIQYAATKEHGFHPPLTQESTGSNTLNGS